MIDNEVRMIDNDAHDQSFGQYSVMHDSHVDISEVPTAGTHLKSKIRYYTEPPHVHHDPKLHQPAFLGTKDDAMSRHEWLVYNDHILKGYRINYHSMSLLFRSSLHCHNETTNFWSHWSAALLFIFLFVYFAVYYLPFDFKPDIILKSREYALSEHSLSSALERAVKDSTQYISNQFRVESSLASDWKSAEVILGLTAKVDPYLQNLRDLEAKLKTSLSSIDLTSSIEEFKKYS